MWPLLSNTVPQGFWISKNVGHPTSRSRGKIGLKIKYMKRGQANTQTSRLLDWIGPGGRFDETKNKKEEIVTCYTWHVTYDMWHVRHDMWHVTRDMWHMTCDMWYVVGGEHSLKISAPSLLLSVIYDFLKIWRNLSDSLNCWINYKSFWRNNKYINLNLFYIFGKLCLRNFNEHFYWF